MTEGKKMASRIAKPQSDQKKVSRAILFTGVAKIMCRLDDKAGLYSDTDKRAIFVSPLSSPWCQLCTTGMYELGSYRLLSNCLLSFCLLKIDLRHFAYSKIAHVSTFHVVNSHGTV